MPHLKLTTGVLSSSIQKPVLLDHQFPWPLPSSLYSLEFAETKKLYQLKLNKNSDSECRISRIHRWWNAILFPVFNFQINKLWPERLKFFLEAILWMRGPELEIDIGPGFFVNHDAFMGQPSKSFTFLACLYLCFSQGSFGYKKQQLLKLSQVKRMRGSHKFRS